MIVTVVDRKAMSAAWGSPGLLRILTKTVEISDACPKCGGPRGEATKRRFYEDGISYAVDCWANPCGHVDRYEDVIVEGKILDSAAI